jgi:hypothetical protein
MTVYAGPGTEAHRSTRFAIEIGGVDGYVYGMSRAALVYLPDYWDEDEVIEVSFVTSTATAITEMALQFLGGAITSVDIYPHRAKISSTIVGDTVTFSLAPGQTAWVVVNGEYGEPCIVRCLVPIATPEAGDAFVYYDGSQTEVAAATTLVFTNDYCIAEGGTISIGQQFPVRAGGTAFIEGGAVVEGSLDLSQDDNTDVDGHGVLVGTFSTPEAVALISDFDTKLTYSMIYALEPDFQHIGSRVRGITIVKPPFYAVFGANTAVDVLSIGIWAPNCDGLHLAADPSDSNNFSATNCVVWSCDDCVNISEYIGSASVANCLLASVASATFLVGYWPATNYGLASTMTNNVVISMQELGAAPLNGIIVQAWSDGEASEGDHVIADYTFEGLHIEGPNSRAPVFYLANVLYPWGAQGKAKGQICNMTFNDVTVETTPTVRSIVRGRDKSNHPTWVRVSRMSVGGVPVGCNNHASYFDVDDNVTAITFDGRPV